MNKEIETLLEKHFNRMPNGWNPKVVDVLMYSVHFIDYFDSETGKISGLKMIIFDRYNGYKYFHMTYEMVHETLLLIDTLNG